MSPDYHLQYWCHLEWRSMRNTSLLTEHDPHFFWWWFIILLWRFLWQCSYFMPAIGDDRLAKFFYRQPLSFEWHEEHCCSEIYNGFDIPSNHFDHLSILLLWTAATEAQLGGKNSTFTFSNVLGTKLWAEQLFKSKAVFLCIFFILALQSSKPMLHW